MSFRVLRLAGSALVAALLVGGGARLLAYVRPLAQATDVTFLGDSIDYAGSSVAMVGDVNGDGLDDMLMGAELGELVNDRQPGRAYLVLGRAGAPWGTSSPLAHADASFVGVDHLEHAGSAVAGAGDVNGDGLADFLVGAWLASPTATLTNAGRAYLVLGRRAADWGLLFPLEQADASFDGEAAGDFFGHDVAGAGDVNGDGLGDFLIGAYQGRGMQGRAGKAYLYLGRTQADWGHAAALDGADAVFLGERSSDFAGMALAGAGDVDGDGLGDMLIGALGNDAAGREAGKVYLVRGRRQADWGTGFDLAGADASFQGTEAGLGAGRSVAGAGDVNRDGLADMLVGAGGQADDAADGLRGRDYLLLGRSAADWGGAYDLAGADTTFSGVPLTDTLGCAVAGAGDVNGDGFDDVLLSALDRDPLSGQYDTGRCYLVLGRQDAARGAVSLAEAEQALDLTRLDGVGPGAATGYSLAGGGDVNGDRLSDVLVGSPRSEQGGQSAGQVDLILGKGMVFRKVASASQVNQGDTVTFTLRYTYTDAYPLQAVRLADLLPQGSEYVRCAGGITCGLQGRTVIWNLGAVQPQAMGAAGVAVRVAADVAAGAVLTNTAMVTSPLLLNPVLSRALVRVVAPAPSATATPTDTPTPTVVQPTRTDTPGVTATSEVTPTLEPSATSRSTSEPPGGGRALLPALKRGSQ
jgi:hypothetical protein